MMTVRHVDVDGHERVFEVDSVDRTPPPDNELVFGIVRRIASGTVYVMNDAGKTVAKYEFGKQQKEQTHD